MKAKSQVTIPSVNVGALFGRFHAIIFAVVVGGGLAAAVYLMSNILEQSSAPEGYKPESVNTTFDTETIKNVEGLRKLSTTPKPLSLPSGRTDPFPQ